jgi:hypothetical protein
VNKAAWIGDGVNSGILGLAMPLLTAVYKGSDPNKDVDSDSNFEPYNPFFYSAVADKKVHNPCKFFFLVYIDQSVFVRFREAANADTM